MRHEYVGDIGDFGKYALLRTLGGSDLTLGVVWYLNQSRESNNDGRITRYEELRHCDPELHDRLRSIVEEGQRSLASIQSAFILPKTTIFYGDAVPSPDVPCLSSVTRKKQFALRESWHSEGLRSLSKAELVFLDPDNGLAGTRTQRHSVRSSKYAFIEEVRDWLDAGKSVVLYQHQQRRKLQEQVRGQLAELGQSGWALTFRRVSVRIYYVLPANEEHRQLLMERTNSFLESEWGRKQHFCLTTLRDEKLRRLPIRSTALIVAGTLLPPS